MTTGRSTYFVPRRCGLKYTATLTDREREVLRLIADGSSNAEIAAGLVVSERTVARHVANVYAKIDAHNRAQATAYALTHALAH